MNGDNSPSPAAELRKKISDALNAFLVLHVTTVVGQASVANADDSGAISSIKLTDANQKVANTVINTVLGDGTTIYSPDFVTDQTLVDIHKSAVQTAHDIRKETMDILKSVLQDFKDVLN
jgi:hypothetical protein